MKQETVVLNLGMPHCQCCYCRSPRAKTSLTTIFKEEFLSNIILPGGKIIGKNIIPKLGYDASQLPKLLPRASG